MLKREARGEYWTTKKFLLGGPWEIITYGLLQLLVTFHASFVSPVSQGTIQGLLYQFNEQSRQHSA